MAQFKLTDRTGGTTTTTGTGPFAINGSISGFQSFSTAGFAVGDTFWGTIKLSGSSWVTGLMTYSAVDEVTVTTPYEGSSGVGTAVSFGAGTKEVFVDFPASKTNLLRSYLSGLTLSTAGSSATFGVAAGEAADSTNVAMMRLLSAYTKTTSAWAVGSGNGSLDTGTIANSTWYHVWLIRRSDTGIVDVLVSTSATAPTMPGSGAYDQKRRIGSMLTDGSAQWVAFTQVGDRFIPSANVQETNFYNVSIPTSATLAALIGIPTGVSVLAQLRLQITGGGSANSILFQSPYEASAIASTGNLTTFANASANNGVEFQVLTNTSAQVRWSSGASGGTSYLYSVGWIDRRGRDD